MIFVLNVDFKGLYVISNSYSLLTYVYIYIHSIIYTHLKFFWQFIIPWGHLQDDMNETFRSRQPGIQK